MSPLQTHTHVVTELILRRARSPIVIQLQKVDLGLFVLALTQCAWSKSWVSPTISWNLSFPQFLFCWLWLLYEALTHSLTHILYPWNWDFSKFQPASLQLWVCPGFYKASQERRRESQIFLSMPSAIDWDSAMNTWELRASAFALTTHHFHLAEWIDQLTCSDNN